MDAAEDFGLGTADYRVPQKWELGLQNQMLESLVTQGYNAFLVFPGDPVGTVAIANELADTGAPVIALAGCLKDPSDALLCMATAPRAFPSSGAAACGRPSAITAI